MRRQCCRGIRGRLTKFQDLRIFAGGELHGISFSWDLWAGILSETLGDIAMYGYVRRYISNKEI